MSKILLFIPMYNCEKQIVRVLGQLTPEVCQFLTEAIVVNNRSTDGGEAAVLAYLAEHELPIPVRLLRNRENYGLGGSHKVAFNYALAGGFDYVIVLHGDDQGHIADLLPSLRSGAYREADCLLGARFMKGSRLVGYSSLRIWGNYGFNLLFSIVVGRRIYDLGSGLNMYKTEALKSKFFMNYPDTLYFNDCMILASCYYKQQMMFCPITWTEEDQVSNNKILKFAWSLLKMLGSYLWNKREFIESDMRLRKIEKYEADLIS